MTSEDGSSSAIDVREVLDALTPYIGEELSASIHAGEEDQNYPEIAWVAGVLIGVNYAGDDEDFPEEVIVIAFQREDGNGTTHFLIETPAIESVRLGGGTHTDPLLITTGVLSEPMSSAGPLTYSFALMGADRKLRRFRSVPSEPAS